jgi:hypothetical protein
MQACILQNAPAAAAQQQGRAEWLLHVKTGGMHTVLVLCCASEWRDLVSPWQRCACSTCIIMQVALLCRTGFCSKGAKCDAVHRRSLVVPCPGFAAAKQCKIDGCTLQHKVVPSLMPMCVFHFKVRC